ncbi:FKBP-type peptidyl-prolyl cis-trans isomerase [Nocardioides sp.]|uniref:FKBP-type peptidyl-prolyl cis-trans isomerase n=1 Tax=Nocardioides sp. TaxID=35761 RepID=UPI003529B11B
MPRPLRRLLLPVAALLLLAGLAACGDSSDDPKEASADSAPASSGTASDAPSASAEDKAALATLKVTGDFGKEPKVEFSKVVEATGLASTTITEGDGPAVAEGDSVFAQFWVGNGATQKQVYSSYDGKPQLLTLSDSLIPAIRDSLVGVKFGSRVLVVSAPAQAFGDTGNTQLGIGNADSVVFVIDVVSQLPDGPSGTDRTPAAWAPKIVSTDDVPTALDFAAAGKPSGRFQRTTVIQGNGPVTKTGDHLYVNYLGQVYGGDKPFDDSYSRGTPFDFDLGAGRVVAGWDQGLVGVKVGSRVILQVPPKLGYGESGSPDAGIKGTDTMYFVVDVLAAN